MELLLLGLQKPEVVERFCQGNFEIKINKINSK